MTFTEKIQEDLKNSLKGGKPERAGVLRLLLSEINNKQKEKFGAANTQLVDEDVVTVLQREAKKRKESIELFRKGDRADLVKKEEAELVVVQEYLPKQLGESEIKSVIDKLAATGLKDFNSLMKESMKELKGKADGKQVGEIIKKLLSS